MVKASKQIALPHKREALKRNEYSNSFNDLNITISNEYSEYSIIRFSTTCWGSVDKHATLCTL